MHKKNILYIFFALIIGLACNDDRKYPFVEPTPIIDPPTTKALMENTVALPPKKVITKPEDLKFVTFAGNIFEVRLQDLETLQGQAVSLPIEVELLEITTYQEMIYYDRYYKDSDRILGSGGFFYLKIYKNNEELRIKENGQPYNISFLSELLFQNKNYDAKLLKPFTSLGVFSDKKLNWKSFSEKPTWNLEACAPNNQPCTKPAIELKNTFNIDFRSKKMGWFGLGTYLNDSKRAKVTLSSDINIKGAYIWLIMKQHNTAIRLENLGTVSLPQGENFKLAVMGVSKDYQKWYMDIQTFKATNKLKVPINIKEVPPADFYKAQQDL